MSDVHRLSFEAVAEEYERARPFYADEAVRWVAGRMGIGAGARVLDLGAGTGKLTRQLLTLGADVVAVEPGPAMRAVLEREAPAATALPGSAEAIPLEDGSVDAVAVGQAFHWFRTDEALAEMHRVLRPDGGFALLWNGWDDEDPLLAAVDELLDDFRPPDARLPAWRERYDETLFGPLEERTFRQTRELTVDALVAWAASTSALITASPDDRALVEDRIRALGRGHAGTVSVRTDVALARRLS